MFFSSTYSSSFTSVVGCVDVVVVVTHIVIVVVIIVGVIFVGHSILPLFKSLYLDFFFCQEEPTFIVKTDKGIELDCLTVVQFNWAKSSQVEAKVEFLFG